MKVLLLAAGAGRKMWPYSELRQKCALPVCNVPAVRRLADDLLTLGVEGIVVGIGAHAASVRHALHGLPEDRLSFVDVTRAQGTAEAAWSAIRSFPDTNEWLVVYGDLVCPRENLAALRDRFQEDKPAAAVLVAPFDHEDSRDGIGAEVCDGRLARIEGHSRDEVKRLCGAFALSSAAFPALRDNPGVVRHVPVGGMPPVEADIAESLQILLDDDLDVAAVECPEFVVDLDKPWHILEANQHLIEYLAARCDRDVIPASCRISDGAEIEGRLILGENVAIGKRAVIRGTLWAGDSTQITNGPILGGPVCLGRDVRVRDYCLLEGGTVCGDRGIYGHGSEFSGVAFDNVYLYHYCEISGVLGSSVDVGAATVCGTLRFDDREAPHRVNGRWETPHTGANETYIGDYSRTGVNAILMPGRTVGCYSCVGPGVILYEDLPSRQVITVRQELEVKPWGPERYGW
jgi:bifunctional UDP-N-acetylglucosamine pyrophosphorylase/glucosamine-1-phosphate N-acetyltransferase